MALLAAIPLSASCEPSKARYSPIRPIDGACLPAGKPSAEMPLYRADLDADYEQIAYVDSIPVCKDEPSSMSLMMKDIKERGREAGADAIIRVKLAFNRTDGFVNNPNTPFDSVMQGSTKTFFLRGIAIKYRTKPDGEPAMIPEPRLSGKKTGTGAQAGAGQQKKGKSGGFGSAIGSISQPQVPTVKTPQY